MMFVVYFTTTGDADSFGTVLADPMPDQFTVRPLTDDETAMLADGTRTIEPRPPFPDPDI
jgi:hypothetical protein